MATKTYLGSTEVNKSYLGSDEIKVYTTDYTPQAFVPPGSPLLYVDPSIKPTGDIITDSSGNNHTGSMRNRVAYQPDISSPTYNFPIFENAKPTVIEFQDFGDTYDNITMVTWFRSDDVAIAAVQPLLSKWNETGNKRGAQMVVEAYAGGSTLATYISTDGSFTPSLAAYTFSTGSIVSNTWYMVTLRMDGPSGLFYNTVGSSSYNDLYVEYEWQIPATAQPMYVNGEPWVFGAQRKSEDAEGYTNSRFLVGNMGHVLVYNDFLSDAQIEQIWDDTKGYYGIL